MAALIEQDARFLARRRLSLALRPWLLLLAIIGIITVVWWVVGQHPALTDWHAMGEILGQPAANSPGSGPNNGPIDAQFQLALLAPAYAAALCLAMCGCWLLAAAHYLRERKLVKLLSRM